jgi:hypothetical protein
MSQYNALSSIAIDSLSSQDKADIQSHFFDLNWAVREEAAQKDNMRGKKLARLSEQISHSES